MKKFRVFASDPRWRLDEIVDTREIAEQKAAAWKKDFPEVKAYLQEVEEL